MSPREELRITPEVKVGELLDVYPQLESVLIELAPPFAKLKNPVLRKTVARVTSLQQAARVAGIPVSEIVNRLRKEVGDEERLADVPLSAQGTAEPPPWFSPDRIAASLDVRPILDRGEKPLNEVLGHFRTLPAGRIFELTAPLLPAPLIDMGKQRELMVWSKQESAELFRVYFYRPAGSPGDPDDDLVDIG